MEVGRGKRSAINRKGAKARLGNVGCTSIRDCGVAISDHKRAKDGLG